MDTHEYSTDTIWNCVPNTHWHIKQTNMHAHIILQNFNYSVCSLLEDLNERESSGEEEVKRGRVIAKENDKW